MSMIFYWRIVTVQKPFQPQFLPGDDWKYKSGICDAGPMYSRKFGDVEQIANFDKIWFGGARADPKPEFVFEGEDLRTVLQTVVRLGYTPYQLSYGHGVGPGTKQEPTREDIRIAESFGYDIYVKNIGVLNTKYYYFREPNPPLPVYDDRPPPIERRRF